MQLPTKNQSKNFLIHPVLAFLQFFAPSPYFFKLSNSPLTGGNKHQNVNLIQKLFQHNYQQIKKQTKSKENYL